MKLNLLTSILFTITLSPLNPVWSMEDRTIPLHETLKRKRETPLDQGIEEEHKKNSSPIKKVKSYKEKKTRFKKLTHIRTLRPHFDYGYLHITHENYDLLLEQSKKHKESFNGFDGGVFVKNWKASKGFDSLVELLYSFTYIKNFKIKIDWDAERSPALLLGKALQFYEDLEKLYIPNCRLAAENILEFISYLPSTEKLKILNVCDNTLNSLDIEELENHFTKLTKLKFNLDRCRAENKKQSA